MSYESIYYTCSVFKCNLKKTKKKEGVKLLKKIITDQTQIDKALRKKFLMGRKVSEEVQGLLSLFSKVFRPWEIEIISCLL